MLFNSVQFFIFFPIVTIGYFLLPHRFRWVWLLAASCLFYMTFIPWYIVILAGTILIDYVAGIYIEKSVGWKRRVFLAASIVANVGILMYFKYYNFFIGNVNVLAQAFGWNYSLESLSIILPIGLSFHTFQAMSYTIEVYRGAQKAEKNLGIYALYVMFYPQLVAGPIERPQNLLHQFREEYRFEYTRVIEGLKLMAWGLFKKMVIADNAALFVDSVYGSVHHYIGIPLIIATVLFAIQVYYDFSGYSDIAIGSARVMGFSLMKNFDRPYSATSIPDFWKRWHISLTTWFRDYIYIPLNKSKATPFRLYVTTVLIFFLSGLWHGAAWHYVAWGVLHGVYMVLSIATRSIRRKVVDKLGLITFPRLVNWYRKIWTFLLVCFSFIFFRANSIQDAWYIVEHCFVGLSDSMSQLVRSYHVSNTLLGQQPVILCALFVSALYMFGLVRKDRFDLVEATRNRPTWFRWGAYYVLFALILLFGIFTKQQFIYFQF